MEKFHSSKAWLKMASGGMHPSHPPQDPPLYMYHFSANLGYSPWSRGVIPVAISWCGCKSSAIFGVFFVTLDINYSISKNFVVYPISKFG